MAPTSPPKRVTRARAAAKKTDTTKDAKTKTSAPTKVTMTAPTRKTKPATVQTSVEVVEAPKRTATKPVKSTTLAVAPRRRLKVTPLDVPSPVEELPVEPPKESAKPKRTATRTKKTATKEKEEEDVEPPTKTRSRVTKTTDKDAVEKEEPAPKTRGRPKRAAAAQAEESIQQTKDEVMPPPRQTRGRSASTAEPTTDTATAAPKAKTATRKKVTFQDLPANDKENLPVAPKRAGTRKEPTPATGIRAKPVRKPAAATTKKSTATTAKVTKRPPRALTPKKPSQVNRQQTPPESDGEDELSGAKTPVRDLSLSPKRNPQLGARLSPIKKIDFTQKVGSPDASAEPTSLFSPARRPHSPTKETVLQSPLKASPRRVEVPPFFPNTAHQPVNMAATFAPPSMSQSLLIQSPKRVVLDPTAFSQSALKPRRSPLKESLLQSPARRLFSPAKSKTPVASETHRSAGTPENVAVSSHFRASVSPQRSVRVHRMSDEELAEELKDAVDFDQSVLNVRSPLKIKPVVPQVPQEADMDMLDVDLAPALEEAMEPMATDRMDGEGSVRPVCAMENEVPSIDGDTSHDQVDEGDASNDSAIEDDPTPLASKPSGPRLSEVLFRSARFREEDSSSEDELAADQTPDRAPRLFRSSLTGASSRPRHSTVAPSNLSRHIGLTPLAAQMSGWLASSPEKKSIKKKQAISPFSPVAALHVDGEVQISRQSTPRHNKSPLAQTSSGRSARSRVSAVPSMDPTPEKTSFFEEQMIAHDADEQMADVEEEVEVDEAIYAVELESSERAEVDNQTEQEESTSESPEDTVIIGDGNGELTADFMNFTNPSTTAMVDFAKLAGEADYLAPAVDEPQQSSSEPSVYGDENVAPVKTEVVVEAEAPGAAELFNAEGVDDMFAGKDHATSVPSQHVAEFPAELPQLSSPTQHDSVETVTPIKPNLDLQRFANTVVSKVPLRPEGDASPIKVIKKRSHSLSSAGHNNADSPPKRPHLTPIGKFAARSISDNEVIFSPDRSIRSAAPSPAHSTPGEMSFAVSDFGDSTLDGIDIPEVEMEFDVGPPTTTTTPATTKSVKTMKSAATTPSRTPLKSVGAGILHGAVVYVEVHTTEGADASGVYVDLLAQMGARCVRDWRWNPRASFGGDESGSAKVGITHVVYKDGGKRTLEKVRDAKGEVWCVGVRWVLDCERESKWLDEAPYSVDHAILPRGGSRRRKSMEPRALINEQGSLSAARNGRRSISAEFLTQQMREELVNTPVRTYIDNNAPAPASAAPSEASAEPADESTELSSTYNSPTTTMNVRNVGVSTPTDLLNWDPATSATPAPVGRGTHSSTALFAGGRQGGQIMGLKSAPAKQINKGIFDRDDDDDVNMDDVDAGVGGDAAKAEKNKGQVDQQSLKMKQKLEGARRRTMGWKPRVGSPLGKF